MHSLNLVEKTIRQLPPPELSGGNGNVKCWVVKVLGTSADGKLIWLRTGQQTRSPDDGAFEIAYAISEWTLETGRIRTLSRLHALWV